MQLPGTRNRDELLVDTACWANLAFACIVGALTRVLAPLYALVVEQPEITLVVRCLAVLVPVSSLSGIHTARKLGEFRHKAVATRVISGGALGGAARSPPPLQTSVYGVR
jgi:hypothetical protein